MTLFTATPDSASEQKSRRTPTALLRPLVDCDCPKTQLHLHCISPTKCSRGVKTVRRCSISKVPFPCLTAGLRRTAVSYKRHPGIILIVFLELYTRHLYMFANRDSDAFLTPAAAPGHSSSAQGRGVASFTSEVGLRRGRRRGEQVAGSVLQTEEFTPWSGCLRKTSRRFFFQSH